VQAGAKIPDGRVIGGRVIRGVIGRTTQGATENNTAANIREVTQAREYAEWMREAQREEDYRKKCEEAEED